MLGYGHPIESAEGTDDLSILGKTGGIVAV